MLLWKVSSLNMPVVLMSFPYMCPPSCLTVHLCGAIQGFTLTYKLGLQGLTRCSTRR